MVYFFWKGQYSICNQVLKITVSFGSENKGLQSRWTISVKNSKTNSGWDKTWPFEPSKLFVIDYIF